MEFQTPEGEALRNDGEYSYVAAWGFRGVGNAPVLHKKPLKMLDVVTEELIANGEEPIAFDHDCREGI